MGEVERGFGFREGGEGGLTILDGNMSSGRGSMLM